jgi:DNA-binding transcriptional LysR family regulator
LLHRSRRRVTPTEVGADYYQQCVLALDTLEEARQQAREGTAQAQGELRLTAPPWCATPHFAQMLADYRLAYPGVTLALQLESRHVDLAARGVDLALRVTAQPEPHLIVRPITAIRFDWVASPAYLARHGQPADRAALAAHHGLLPDYVAIDTPMQRCAESNDALMLYQLALAGMGVAFLPEWVTAQDLAQGRLQRVPAAGGHALTLYAAYLDRAFLSAKVRSLIDFLAARWPPP